MPTSATSPFEALPVELKTQILSSLSVSEILRTIIERQFSTLAKISSFKSSSKSCAASSTYDIHATPFLTALASFVAHRGIRRWGLRMEEALLFVAHREYLRHSPRSPYSLQDRIDIVKAVHVVVAIVELHIIHHTPHLTHSICFGKVDYQTFEWVVSFWVRGAGARALVPLVGDDLWRVYEAVTSQRTPGGIFKFPLLPQQGEEVPVNEKVPDWPLTNLASRCQQDWYRDAATLVRLLGVPPIPDARPNGWAEFAYCVKTERTYKMVKDAVEQGVESLAPAVKAKILEELFLF